MSEDFDFGDLLEGIEPPRQETVVRKQNTAHADAAHSAWRLWCTETQRSAVPDTDRKFLTAYVDQLRAGRQDDYLRKIVRGAARLPIKAANADDTRRVVNALRTPSTGRTAVSALDSDKPVIPYPHGDGATLLASIEDVARSCRMEPAYWSEHDQGAAGILIENFDPEQIEEAATDASLSIGTEAVLPTDVLRVARSAQQGRRATKASAANADARGTYEAGIAERDRVQGVEFALDDLANEMLKKGVPGDKIVAVHASAPEGYWNEVFHLVVNEGRDNATVYGMLVDQFDGWHPDSRRGALAK